MTLSEIVGWVGLLVGSVALIRIGRLKRAPNLTKPLEDEVELLQTRQMEDRIEITKLNAEIQKLHERIKKLSEDGHEMRKAITLLRRQLINLNETPLYGEQFVTGPLDGGPT